MRSERGPYEPIQTMPTGNPSRKKPKPEGRICANRGCEVILSRYNHSDTCWTCASADLRTVSE